MKIAILGTRGIPASYGGFETFAEKLSENLVKRGHQTTVYGRKPFFVSESANSEFQGVKIVRTSTIFHKYLETPIHSLTSFLDVLLARKFDAIILCNAANSPFSWLAALKGIPVYTNVDGVERKRKKWNWLGRFWYLAGEASAVLFSRKIIADADCIAEYYRQAYNAESEVIAYGAEEIHLPPGETLKKLNLIAGQYLLYVSRLEPENNALGVIRAYNQSGLDSQLVIVGDAPYAAEYKQLLLKEAGGNSRVVFTGFQFGNAYRELRSNCAAYIQASEVGGTHPALVEAMAHGNLIIANDVPEHREVLEDCGMYYKKNDFDDLGTILSSLPKMSESEIADLKNRSKQKAISKYSWDNITDKYIKLLSNF